MSGIVQIKKDDWEAFMKDNDELMQRCEMLIKKIQDLEERNRNLEEKLQEKDRDFLRLREVEESLKRNLEETTTVIQRRRALVADLLKESEGLTQ